MRKWMLYGLYILVLLPLFSINIELPDLGTKINTPLEPFMAIFGLMLLIYAIITRDQPKYRLLDLSVVLLLIAAGISTMFSRDFFISGKAFVVLISYAFVFYASHRILKIKSSERDLLWNIYTAGFLVLMVYSLVQLMVLGINYHNTYEMAKPFSQGHTLLIAMGFPTFLRALDKAFKRQHPNLFLSYAGFFFLFVLISYSRLYWIVLPFFAFLFAVHYWRKIRWWLVGGAAFMVVVSVIGLFLLKQQRMEQRAWEDPNDHKSVAAQVLSITNWRANDSNLERVNRWRIGMIMFEESPITGIGLGNYTDEYFNYSPQVTFYEPSVADKRGNAHNVFLGWLFEMGLIGFAAGLFILVAIFYLIYRKRKHPLAFLTSILILNFVFLGLIEDWMLLEKIAPYWWLSVAYVSTLYYKSGIDFTSIVYEFEQ